MKKNNNPPKITADQEEEKSKSAVIHLSGKTLNLIEDLQSKYYTRFHNQLSKSDAVNLLIGKIPNEAAEKYIHLIISDIEMMTP